MSDDLTRLVKKIRSYSTQSDEANLQKAYFLAEAAHKKQMRDSGEPYFTHPLAVANILADLKLDSKIVIVGLLHDIVEDTKYDVKYIAEKFDDEIALLVDGVTKLNIIEFQPAQIQEAENFRKLLLAMSKDIRILLVKIADRLHNLRTLSAIKLKSRRVKIAQETIEIYSPLAARIGLHNIKEELEDLSFLHIHTEARKSILNRLDYLRKEGGQSIIDHIIKDIEKMIKKAGIKNFAVSGREKTPYSIWLKMCRKNVNFEQLSDLIAFRVLVEDVNDCYQALGVVHCFFHMVPKSFKDYISTPKDNGYQSLHTQVIGPKKYKIEIQIRSKAMHDIAENGIAAHWSHKEAIKYDDFSKEYKWMKQLIDISKNSSDPKEFMRNSQLEMYQDQVFCFSPKGKLIILPNNATAIDFAYAIHSNIGHKCMGCKINGVIAPLKTQIENGDQIEIITSENHFPLESWEDIAFTGKAKTEIRKFIRSKKRTEYLHLGNRILKKFFKENQRYFDLDLLDNVLNIFSKESKDELLIAVGEGLLSGKDVFAAIFPNYHEDKVTLKKKLKQFFASKAKVGKKTLNFPIKGLEKNQKAKFADCCNPLPKESIIGKVNKNKIIEIHHSKCSNAKDLDGKKEYIINLSWNDTTNYDGKFIGKLKIIIAAEENAIADVTHKIAECHTDINNLNIITKSNMYFEVVFDLAVNNLRHLRHTKAALRSMAMIYSVERVGHDK
jgi:GTP diphosphokinase / guanosine-3',5'-bis(diphosphate) 3'-diphosphatase